MEQSSRARQRAAGGKLALARSATGNNRQRGAATHPILGAGHDAIDVGHHAGGGKGAGGQQAPDAAAGVHRNGVQRVVNLHAGRGRQESGHVRKGQQRAGFTGQHWQDMPYDSWAHGVASCCDSERALGRDRQAGGSPHLEDVEVDLGGHKVDKAANGANDEGCPGLDNTAGACRPTQRQRQ